MRNVSGSFLATRRVAWLFVAALLALVSTSRPALAQATYIYTGNTFGSSANPPIQPDDYVSATLTLPSWLPPNQQCVGINLGSAAANLIMQIGSRSLGSTSAAFRSMQVSTDSTGQIVAPWGASLEAPAFAITTFNFPAGQSCGHSPAVVDQFEAFMGSQSNLNGLPGRWAFPSPFVLVSMLTLAFQPVGSIPDVGQSFIHQLQQVATDITLHDGHACQDLMAFAHHVKAQKGQKLTVSQADYLLDTVDRISTFAYCGS